MAYIVRDVEHDPGAQTAAEAAVDPRPLDAPAVFAAALAIIDAEGIEALTMRRLGQELSTPTMTLYGLVTGKEEVLDGVIGAVAGEISVPATAVSWREALRSILTEFRRVCLRHPNVVPLLVHRPPTSPQGAGVVEAGFAYVRAAGFEERSTAQAYRRVLSYAVGFVALETAGFFAATGSAAAGRARDLDAFPHTSEVAPYLAEWDPDEEFLAGVDAILESIAHDLGPGRTPGVSGEGRPG